MKKIESNNKEKRNFTRLMFNIFFWIGLSTLGLIWIVDFNKVQNEKKPIFCISKKNHEFEDGNVEECIGLGYRVFEYNRESIKGVRQFSPFYIPMKK